jgi:hypothetical protein
METLMWHTWVRRRKIYIDLEWNVKRGVNLEDLDFLEG